MTDFGHHVYFEREDDGTVCADVDVGLGIRLRFYSDEPTSPREWEFEEIEVLLAANPRGLSDHTFTPRNKGTAKVVSGELYEFLTREWDRVVGEEGVRQSRLDAERREAILG